MSHHYNTRLQANKKKATLIQVQPTRAQEPLTFAQEEQKQKDLVFVKSILKRAGELSRQDRIMLSAELFQYLVWNPLLFKNEKFRMTTLQKIKDFEQNSINERELLEQMKDEKYVYSKQYLIMVAQNVGLFDYLDILSKKLKNIIETF